MLDHPTPTAHVKPFRPRSRASTDIRTAMAQTHGATHVLALPWDAMLDVLGFAKAVGIDLVWDVLRGPTRANLSAGHPLHDEPCGLDARRSGLTASLVRRTSATGLMQTIVLTAANGRPWAQIHPKHRHRNEPCAWRYAIDQALGDVDHVVEGRRHVSV
jgi:hypothetical protein